MEAPIVQDGAAPSFDKGGISRILRYEQDTSGNFSLLKGHISYPLEKIPLPEKGAVLTEKCDNGLVDILPLGADRVLTLERATIFYEDGRVRNSVRVYDVKLGQDGTIESKKEAYNSSDLENREDVKPSPLGKAQVGKLSPGGQRSENFEGLSFGPMTEKGERTVMLLSDDNGRDNQRTLLVALTIGEGDSK